MPEAKLEDFFLLVVLGQCQSGAKIGAHENLRTKQRLVWQRQDAHAALNSQLWQGGLEEGVRVVAIDHLGLALLGLGGGRHRQGRRRWVRRLPLGEQLPLPLDVLPLLVDPLLLPARRGAAGGP